MDSTIHLLNNWCQSCKENYLEIGLEKLYVDIGTNRVNILDHETTHQRTHPVVLLCVK